MPHQLRASDFKVFLIAFPAVPRYFPFGRRKNFFFRQRIYKTRGEIRLTRGTRVLLFLHPYMTGFRFQNTAQSFVRSLGQRIFMTYLSIEFSLENQLFSKTVFF